jgi:hypothetical protein
LHLQLPAVSPTPDEAREAAHSSEAWLGRILNTAAADEAITLILPAFNGPSGKFIYEL